MTPNRAEIIRMFDRRNNSMTQVTKVSTNDGTNAMSMSPHALSMLRAQNMSSASRISRASKDHESVLDYIRSMRERRQTMSPSPQQSAERMRTRQLKREK